MERGFPGWADGWIRGAGNGAQKRAGRTTRSGAAFREAIDDPHINPATQNSSDRHIGTKKSDVQVAKPIIIELQIPAAQTQSDQGYKTMGVLGTASPFDCQPVRLMI
jgi:hypothetical protein